ncbi:MAG: transporter [bacterium]
MSAIYPGRAVASGADCTKAGEWYQKGLALSDNSAQEIACYQKAVELCPEHAPSHERLGNIYKARRQWDMAVRELQLACEGSDSSDPHTSLGEIYRMQGEYELAIREFHTALDIREEDKRAQANLEYIQRMMGRDDAGGEERSMVPVPIFSREPGLTLSQGITSVSLTLGSMTIRREWISPQERPVDVWRLALGIRYGLTDDLTLGIIPKMFWKKAYIRTWEGESQPSVHGLGDTVVLLKYCLWSRRHTSFAASLATSVPTGDEHKTAWYGWTSYTIPLGSGRYEFMPGLAFSTSFRDLGYLHTNVSYFFPRQRENGLDPGDELSYNLALCRPIPLIGEPYFFSLPVTSLVGQIELNGVYRGEGRGPKIVDGQESRVTFSGGNMLSWSPGIQFLFQGNMMFEAGVQIPLFVPDNPWCTEPVYQIGWTRSFF